MKSKAGFLLLAQFCLICIANTQTYRVLISSTDASSSTSSSVFSSNTSFRVLGAFGQTATSPRSGYFAMVQGLGIPTSVASSSESIPDEFTLSQNYPNPFNPSTKINYQLTDVSCVSLKVFDVLGREVATLVNEQLKPGSYETTFDASRLASGVYLYRLQAGDFVQTRKLVLMK